MPRRAKLWSVREDYRPLLIRIKKKFPNILAHVQTRRIALAGVTGANSPFMARIYRNPTPWSLLTPDIDYMIVFWSTRFDKKANWYKLFVVFHELMHIPKGGQTKGALTFRKIAKHDIEDFLELRHVYGLHLDRKQDILKGEKFLLKKPKANKEHPGTLIK